MLALFALLLWGCGSAYDYYETSQTLNRFWVESVNWPKADSTLVAFADAESISVIYFRGYEPESKKAKKLVSDDSTSDFVFVRYDFDMGESNEPLTFRMILRHKGSAETADYYASDLGEPLFVDIYGCSDYNCLKATKVVIRSEDYSYNVLLKPGDFKISKPKRDFVAAEHGYDCDVTKEYLFHLDIDVDDLKFEADVQKGKETCLERDMICIFC